MRENQWRDSPLAQIVLNPLNSSIASLCTHGRCDKDREDREWRARGGGLGCYVRDNNFVILRKLPILRINAIPALPEGVDGE